MESSILNFKDAAHKISDSIEISDEETPSTLPYPIETSDGKLYCQVCGKLFKSITVSHLSKSHNMTIAEYKEKFGTPFVTDKTKALRKYTNSRLFIKKSDEEKPIVKKLDSSEDIISDNLDDEDTVIMDDDFEPDDFQNVIEEIASIGEEITNEFEEKDFEVIPIPSKDPTMMKTEIAYNLETLFDGHKAVENYIIEEFEVGSFVDTKNLKYSYASDVSVPSKKIALFFPNTFWHNHDLNSDPNRNYKLKEDGWHPIVIHGNNPSFSEIVNALKNADLI